MATILHIEDDPQSLLLVRKLLTAHGHKVVESSSGLDGARLAAEVQPDLVLVDINIPELDGYEVAMLLRNRLPGVPIVAITAEGDRAQSLSVGCDGFLLKPIDVRQFPKLIADFLGGHRERADRDSPSVLRAQGQRMAEHLETKVHELVEVNHRLLQADRLRKEFYRNVTHELATPLTPIVGYLNLLRNEELGPLEPAQRRAIGSIDEAVVRLRATIDNLLDVSQLESGRMRFVFGPYDFAATLRQLLTSWRPVFEQANLTLHVMIPAAPLLAQGDPARVSRALQHVLQNAAKFTPVGGSVAIELRVSATSCEVLVSDSGPGVRSDYLNRIFEPFFQADGSTTRQHEGAGVGLAIVRRVCEAHGGSASANNASSESVAGHTLRGLLIRMQIARAPRAPNERPQ
ncbi:MAG: hybrid sensor histidine kinase/response regulator [Deltaproteobacteria bacterium]|nr:hybrid sensor histidine kinase/response regulator [Deltaproteobacteria bacterium]